MRLEQPQGRDTSMLSIEEMSVSELHAELARLRNLDVSDENRVDQIDEELHRRRNLRKVA